MSFKVAFDLMVYSNAKVKRSHWKGYWEIADGTIQIHCNDGKIVDIRDSKVPLLTISNMLADDWEVATADNCILLCNEME